MKSNYPPVHLSKCRDTPPVFSTTSEALIRWAIDTVHKRILVCAAAVCALLAFCGCQQSARVSDLQVSVVKSNNVYYENYLNSDASLARSALLNSAGLLESATVLEPRGRAELLTLTYFRLYVLELRLGHDAAAKASMIKGQYWVLKKAEVLGISIEEVMRELSDYTPDEVVSYVDRVDKNTNGGQEPRYKKGLIGVLN